MHSSRQGLVALCLVAGIALVGCGGGDDDAPSLNPPPNPAITGPVPAGQVATQSLGTAGGTVRLDSSDGSRFEFVIPAGALPASTTITLRTATATQQQRFVLRFEPAGLLFANGLQGTLTITLPLTLALPATGGLIYDGVPLPVSRLSDGRLQINLASFVDASATPQSASLKSNMRAMSIASSLEGAMSLDTCGTVPQVGNFAEGGLTAADVIETELYGQCMVGAVQQLASSGDYAAAVSAANATAALLQAAGQQGNGGNSSALSFIQQASSIACTALRSQLDTANAMTVNSMGSLYAAIKPILYWQKIVDQLGAMCSNVGATEYVSVVDAKTTEALIYYASAGSAISSASSTEFTAAANEATASRDTLNEVRALQPSAGIQNVLNNQIVERAQVGLLDAILHAPFAACRDNGSYAELIHLADALGMTDSIRNAAQYCGTALSAQSFDSNSTQIATVTPSLGGRLDGQDIEVAASGSLNVTTNGSVTLSGPIRALGCPADNSGGTETLEIHFNNVVVQTMTTAPYLSADLELDVADLLEAVNIDPEDFSSGTLVLRRTASPCNGFWGENPQPLLTLTLRVGICQPSMPYAFCATPFPLTLDTTLESPMRNGRGDVLVVNNTGLRFLPTGGSEALVLPGTMRQSAYFALRFNAVGDVLGVVGSNPERPAVWSPGNNAVVQLPLLSIPAGFPLDSTVRIPSAVLADDGTVIGTMQFTGLALSLNTPEGCRASDFCAYNVLVRWSPPYSAGPLIIDGPVIRTDGGSLSVTAINASGATAGLRPRAGSTDLSVRDVVRWDQGGATEVSSMGMEDRHVAINDDGVLVYEADDGSLIGTVTSSGPLAGVPNLSLLRGLNAAGFGIVCGSPSRLVDTRDGRDWSISSSTLLDPASGWSVNVNDLIVPPCSDSAVLNFFDVDRQGRWTTIGTLHGALAYVVLTPRGVALP